LKKNNQPFCFQAIPSLVGTSVQVNRVFKIPLHPITFISSNKNEEIQVCITKSHCRQHVHARLISYELREGQVFTKFYYKLK